MKPIKMYPAYRYGSDTPWGGDDLRTLYGLPIPDERTGEALVISAIDGLCSTDDAGTTLDELIAEYGARLTGEKYKGEFPLLLKLLCARQRLSVQVHPNDAYARSTEGKLGKTEAWVVLHAEPGAQIVYGLKEGVTRQELEGASYRGEGVEALLRYVPAREDDVFYIPSGTVHAICEGLVLYEIQQSSDVTYRFYDWNRRDAHGNLRPLHIQKALDVSDMDARRNAAIPQTLADGRELLLRNEHFTLERWTHTESAHLLWQGEAFAIITALCEARLVTDGVTLTLAPGESALLPAALDATFVSCEGAFLLAYPA